MNRRLASAPLAREVAERLAAVLAEAAWPEAQAVSLFEMDGKTDLWTVEAYYDHPVSPAVLEEVLRAAGLAGDLLAPAPLPDRDWVAESLRALRPVRATRFVVHGSHDADAARAGEIAILIDAGTAFGTGHHGTTRGCLLALAGLATAGFAPRRVLDVGTGSGVLAIAAARLWRVPVLATDIDAEAVARAAENARLNGCGGLVRCIVADGVRHPLVRHGRVPPRVHGGRRRTSPPARARRRSRSLAAMTAREASALLRGASRGRLRPAKSSVSGARKGMARWRRAGRGRTVPGRRVRHDLVLANILLKPLKRMRADLCARVAPGGRLVLSGILGSQLRALLAVYGRRGMITERRIGHGEWVTVVLRRPRGRVQRS